MFRYRRLTRRLCVGRTKLRRPHPNSSERAPDHGRTIRLINTTLIDLPSHSGVGSPGLLGDPNFTLPGHHWNIRNALRSFSSKVLTSRDYVSPGITRQSVISARISFLLVCCRQSCFLWNLLPGSVFSNDAECLPNKPSWLNCCCTDLAINRSRPSCESASVQCAAI